MTSFDELEHPRDRFGRFKDKVGEVATTVVDALMQTDERVASDPDLQKRIYGNYRRMLSNGNLVTEGKAVEEVAEAFKANNENPIFVAAQARFGKEHVAVIKDDTEGFTNGAIAERRGRVSWVHDHSDDPLNWPDKVQGDITPGDTNATDGLDGVLRHEYGHTVYDGLDAAQVATFRGALPSEWKTTRDALSAYAGYSQRTGNPMEPFCELFSVVTHKDYDRSELPSVLAGAAQILEEILRGG